ncbi:unnamed protein product [Cunninghamella echinulata]
MEESRVSTIIPTITCSTCLRALPIKDLSNHLCYHDDPYLKLSKPSSPLTLDTSSNIINHHRHKPSKSSPLKQHKPLQRNETWKIAKNQHHHQHGLSRSISIESSLSSPSPITPPSQKPLLSFRTQLSSQEEEQEEEKMISFYKVPVTSSQDPSSSLPSPPPHDDEKENHHHQLPLFNTTTTTTKIIPHDHHDAFLKQKKSFPITCFDCKRSIQQISFSIQLDSNHHYHEHCLKCSICRASLNNYNYKDYHGKIYCKKDYQEFVQFKPNCATCHQTIEPHQRPTKAFQHYYHAEHLSCYHCHKPIDEVTTGIVQHKKRMYCRKDFNRLYLPNCQGCKKPIEKETVSSSDGKLKGKWHKHCFHCYQCKQPFLNNTFYVFQNQPYCQHHYHQLNKSLCHHCQLPIEGRCAQTTTLDGLVHAKYHPSCFTCHTCHEQITNIYFTDKDHAIYCSTHGQQKKKRETLFCDV